MRIKAVKMNYFFTFFKVSFNKYGVFIIKKELELFKFERKVISLQCGKYIWEIWSDNVENRTYGESKYWK